MADATVFLDGRGDDRALRLSWHDEAGLVVMSMWRENVCVGSFRLVAEDVPAMIAFLSSGLAASYADNRSARPACPACCPRVGATHHE
jgi:hypothetical protein